MSVDNAVANIRGIRTGIKVKMLEAQKQSMKTYKSFMVGFIAIGIDLLHLALIRGIFTLCRSYVMTLHRWSSVFGRGNCSPIHLSIIVMEMYAPKTTSKKMGYGSIYE
jgi:hypothetical protein